MYLAVEAQQRCARDPSQTPSGDPFSGGNPEILRVGLDGARWWPVRSDDRADVG